MIQDESIPRIYLASQSPRRRQLLQQLGLSPTVLLPSPYVDAEALEATRDDESPIDYVQRVTRLKLEAGLAAVAKTATTVTDLVLAADTTVALGNEIFGKPQSPEAAKTMLARLSGKVHQVHTAVAVCTADGKNPRHQVVSSEVEFAALDPKWIDRYVASGEPMDKAGAYGIQGAAGAMIPRISGSYSAIMGLPLYETLMLIKSKKR
jgi:septum formation protein